MSTDEPWRHSEAQPLTSDPFPRSTGSSERFRLLSVQDAQDCGRLDIRTSDKSEMLLPFCFRKLGKTKARFRFA